MRKGRLPARDAEDAPGCLEIAHGGTLFLDEIGEMPLPLQTRLLRVLEEKEVTRVGGHQPVPVDVRVISATHCNLEEDMQQRAVSP
ncbi:Propionate catabolism operon regulatory protein [Escherichia coli]|uniref:Propionate catabolism operon regulatory protein n=1 Tax=Escherichia coli TaxID=562 RepID=A0A377KB29_ECOLX|nr:Propionate catabolism operon regulatory protein [Escherichia coli]